ncbi:MAG: hypothetical protein AAF483_21310, partial [Planctomycetota bacterium]
MNINLRYVGRNFLLSVLALFASAAMVGWLRHGGTLGTSRCTDLKGGTSWECALGEGALPRFA